MDIQRISGFLSALEENNNREWFEEHRNEYKSQIEIPFRDFIQSLLDRISEWENTGPLRSADAIFRIYRDIRFSKDKTPYKTHLSAIISPEGRSGMKLPGVYFEMAAGQANLYTGIYQTDPPALKKLRVYIAMNPDEFREIYKDKDFVQYFGEIKGEKSKVIPAEFKEISLIEPLLYNKSFYAVSPISTHRMDSDRLKDEILKRYKIARALNKYLRRAMED